MRCAGTAKPLELPFGLWNRVGRRKHKFNRIRQVAPKCPHGRAHWRHLANTIQPSVCGGDAVLCQITLTTCLIWYTKATMYSVQHKTPPRHTEIGAVSLPPAFTGCPSFTFTCQLIDCWTIHHDKISSECIQIFPQKSATAIDR